MSVGQYVGSRGECLFVIVYEAGKNVCWSMCGKQGRMSVGQCVGSRGECLLVNVWEAGENVCRSMCGKQGRMSTTPDGCKVQY